MTHFVNPTNSQDDVYILEGLREDVSDSFRSYEERKFRPDYVESVLDNRYSTDYIDSIDTEWIDENVEVAEEIDSFTAPEVLANVIDESEVIGVEADLEQGLYNIQTYKTAEHEDGWKVWIPYVDDVSGEVVGRIEQPGENSESHVFSYSADDGFSLDMWAHDEVLETAYNLARETAPDAPGYSTKYNEGWFKGQFDILESGLGLISELEETGSVKIDNHSHTGSSGARGGSITSTLENFINHAKKGRIIDYTVSNDNKENIVRIENSGNKFITRDLSTLGFENSDDLIDSRLVPAWRDE